MKHPNPGHTPTSIANAIDMSPVYLGGFKKWLRSAKGVHKFTSRIEAATKFCSECGKPATRRFFNKVHYGRCKAHLNDAKVPRSYRAVAHKVSEL